MKKLVWYARAGNIAKMGPYKTQVEAAWAIRLAPVKPKTLIQVMFPERVPDDRPAENAIFHDNAFIWPEIEECPRQKKSPSSSARAARSKGSTKTGLQKRSEQKRRR